MKKKKTFVLVIFAIFASIKISAQNYDYTVESYYQPLSMEEMIIQAKVNVSLFNKYSDIAMEYYDEGNYETFLYYSNLALDTGYGSGILYYRRGVVFEYFHKYSKAKKEYKRAICCGYSAAQSALVQCRYNQKIWKNRNK